MTLPTDAADSSSPGVGVARSAKLDLARVELPVASLTTISSSDLRDEGCGPPAPAGRTS